MIRKRFHKILEVDDHTWELTGCNINFLEDICEYCGLEDFCFDNKFGVNICKKFIIGRNHCFSLKNNDKKKIS